MPDNLQEKILIYYEKRGLAFPNEDEALLFVITELAEYAELRLARNTAWLRNHPQNKPKTFDLDLAAKELGQVIMMVYMIGYALDIDPIASLEAWIDKKMDKLNQLT